ncbi:hypothetical protein Mahau_2642 [Mahella australiensis 50-1 BON]|uniref:Uncharacterized protein n=1 Tax=Mahella australiensis (strain DSM 15567 / CIP 107919 / 50-1 BON) TaxID=697281 RepID=F3ZYL2_MAHA5|nr:hypothetical protein Mahau_2642 [Mahella australiensis 50-1 BON]
MKIYLEYVAIENVKEMGETVVKCKRNIKKGVQVV